MKRLILAFIVSAALPQLRAATENLLPGDADFEREWTSLTRGTWGFPYVNDGTFFRWDRSGGYESAGCVKMLKVCSLSSRPFPLPAGTYTVSGWFRAEKKSAFVSLFALPQRNSWQGVVRTIPRARRKISDRWTRVSYTFSTDGKEDHCILIRNLDSAVRADRLMLNRGETPLPWEPSDPDWILLTPPPSECNVYPVGQPVAVDVRLHRTGGAKDNGKLLLEVSDVRGKRLIRKEIEPGFDDSGDFRTRLELPRDRAGWFMVRASFPGMREETLRLAVIHPAAPRAPGLERFTAVYNLEYHPETARLFGDLWSSRRSNISRLKSGPPWKFPELEELERLKKKGRLIKFSFGLAGPGWMLDPAEKAGAAALKVPAYRLLPAEEMLETHWRPIVAALLDRYGKYADMFECSGEIDASVGLNTYYKSREPGKCRGNYILGSPVRRAAKQISITAEEIRRRFPHVPVSGVRPSDVDSHFHYLFSSSVLRQVTGKGIDSFGLDCYPRPRWIGPGRPAPGTEQQLILRRRDADAVMKKYTSGSRVFVSEYGYFIDCRETENPLYTSIHARLYARSLLKARALGMTSFFCFDGFNSGLEGGSYHMGIWYRNEPLPAAAAIAEAVQMVENVTSVSDCAPNARTDGVVFRYADGSAGAALWSFTEHYEPDFRIPGDPALGFRDYVGSDMKVPLRKGEFRIPLRQEPVYIRRNVPGEDNFARLRELLASGNVADFPAEVVFRPETWKVLKMRLAANFRSGTRRGVVRCSSDGFSKAYPFTLQGGGTAVVRLPFSIGRPLEAELRFEDVPGSKKFRYLMGRRLWIRRIKGPLKPDGTTGDGKKIPGFALAGSAQIAPFDHNSWSGNDDLSVRLRLAHDGENLYIVAVARDDRHFGGLNGDSLQLAFDPLLDHPDTRPGWDPDDFVLTAALTEKGPVCRITEGRGHPEAFAKHRCRIVRDDAGGTTVYWIKLPLAALGPDCGPHRFFGFDFRLNDDDTGGGADCWVFWRNTFDGKGHPERGELCLLE
ncbi:MAG: hypothetical protein IJU70_02415 [Lentisphaeria bacterium]|nr:hypothetical protein [Lentisphaeria bacterium]